MTGPTPDPVTPVNQVVRNDNPNNLPSLQDQILNYMSSLKALIKQHDEKFGTLIELICLTFDDEENGDKAKCSKKGTEEVKGRGPLEAIQGGPEISAYKANH
ncbi:hypothetical protein Tco_1115076 [Tanacetum coccineum]